MIKLSRQGLLWRRIGDQQRLTIHIIRYLLGVAAFYVASSVTREFSGTSADSAWVPNSTSLGSLVGFAIGSLLALVVILLAKRRRQERQSSAREKGISPG